MNPEEIKIRFKNGSIPDENDFGLLIDEATKKVDLTEYATKDEIPTVPDVSQFITLEDIPAPQDLSHLATKSEIPDVSSFITLEDIPPTDLSEYAKVADIPSLDGLLSEVNAENLYVRKDSLDTVLADYAKKSEIPDVSEFITL